MANFDRPFDPQNIEEKMEFVNMLPPKFRTLWIEEVKMNQMPSMEEDE